MRTPRTKTSAGWAQRNSSSAIGVARRCRWRWCERPFEADRETTLALALEADRNSSTRRGGRTVIIAPDGGDAWAPTKPRPDETLIRALARAHRWKRMIEDGTYRSAAEIAKAEGVTRSFVNRLLRLTLLAPDIQEAILDGQQPKGMQLAELTRAVPSVWEQQRQRLPGC